MTYAEQISATVAAILGDANERSEILELRDEYEHAFAEWARAVGDEKRWIADEGRAMNLSPAMVLTIRRQSTEYRRLEERADRFYFQMEEARARCVAAGDEDWSEAQESREYDVENA
jgi:hypothetical protein